jgi:hypothetical protein
MLKNTYKYNTQKEVTMSIRMILALALSLQGSALLAESLLQGEKHFYLEETHCNANLFKTYLKILDSKKQQVGQFSDTFVSLNSDLTLYDKEQSPLLSTDIKTLFQLRKKIDLYDQEQQLVAHLEEDHLSKMGQVLTSFLPSFQQGDEHNHEFRFKIYNADHIHIATIRQQRDLDTTLEILDPAEKRIFARAVKKASAQLKANFCFSPRWEISMYDEILQPEVVATLVALKAHKDIKQLSKSRWGAVTYPVRKLF